jgi:hypothetical protein
MIHFDAATHKYSKDGYIYTSVTTLIKSYCNPFDSEYWSTYKAVKDILIMKRGDKYWSDYKREAGGWRNVVDRYRTQGHQYDLEILTKKEWYIQEWIKTGRIAADRGNRIHEEREKEIKGKTHIARTIQGNTVILQVSQDKVLPMQDFYQDKVYTEIIISNDRYKVAGMVDLTEKHNTTIHLSDYKTYKELTFEGFDNQTMKEPLQGIADCKYQMAQLQLSLYAWMFEQLGYTVGSITMIHLMGEDGKEEKKYPMIYKKNDIEAMLKHYDEQRTF